MRCPLDGRLTSSGRNRSGISVHNGRLAQDDHDSALCPPKNLSTTSRLFRTEDGPAKNLTNRSDLRPGTGFRRPTGGRSSVDSVSDPPSPRRLAFHPTSRTSNSHRPDPMNWNVRYCDVSCEYRRSWQPFPRQTALPLTSAARYPPCKTWRTTL